MTNKSSDKVEAAELELCSFSVVMADGGINMDYKAVTPDDLAKAWKTVETDGLSEVLEAYRYAYEHLNEAYESIMKRYEEK